MNMQDPASGLLDLICVERRSETPSIKTFRLRHADGPVTFIPGQALAVKVPMPDGPAWRSFTISGARDGDLELTVKAQGQNGATRWMHDHLAEGGSIAARIPCGGFTLARRSLSRLAFISAGSGATPMMAMLRQLAVEEPEVDLAWFHLARSPQEVLFSDQLVNLQVRMPNLTAGVSISGTAPGWFGYRGRISRRMLSTAIPDIGRREVFCCGPQGFMTETRLIHTAEGGSSKQFHIESFGGSLATPILTTSATVDDAQTYRMTINGRDLQLRPDETVLQASLRQGVVIPCGCGAGMCGTCMVRLESGDVTCAANGGLTEDDAARGYILACSSRAGSDVVITTG